MQQTVSVIGLGLMGNGMAKNLLQAGFVVKGFDIESTAMSSLVGAGGVACDSPAEAVLDADALLVLVFNEEQAQAVLFGQGGALPALTDGRPIVMHTTMAPKQIMALGSRAAEMGYPMLDAPVTGGKAGADAGTLTAMVSGDPEAIAQVRSILQPMTSKIVVCGDSVGAASTVKLINQMMCGVHFAIACEALAMAAKTGVDLKAVYEVIGNGAAASTVWQTRAPAILAGDLTPKGFLDIFTKDLDAALQAGKDAQMPLPMTASALQQFLGPPPWDTAVTMRRRWRNSMRLSGTSIFSRRRTLDR